MTTATELETQSVLDTLERTDLGYWSLDVSRRMVTALPHALLLFGLDQSTCNLRLDAFLKRVADEDRSAFRTAIEAAAQCGTPLDHQYSVQSPHGRRTLRSKGHARRDDRGRVTHVEGITFDVTDQNAALKRLAEAESLYGNLVTSLDGIVWQADAVTFAFDFISPQVERILGYTPGEWLSDPEFWVKHVHPDDRDWCVRFCLQQTADGKDHAFEYRMIDAKGCAVWLRDIVTVVREPGKPLCLRGIMVDISEQKRMKLALGESEKRFWAFFEEIEHAMVMADLSGRILRANRSFYRLIDWPQDARQRLSVNDFYHPDELPVAAQNIATAHSKHVVRRLIRKDGQIIWALIIGVVIRPTEQEPYWLALFRDITTEKQAEQALQESEERFRLIFEQSTAAMVIRDQSGHILQVNHAFEELLGFSEAEARQIPCFSFVHPEDQSPLHEQLDHSSQVKTVIRLLHKDGHIIWGKVSAMLITPQDSASKWVTIVQDVSAEKQAERLLRESEARYRIIANETPAYLWTMTFDHDETDIFVNRRLNAFLGVPEDTAGKDWTSYVHPDDRENAVQQIRNAIEQAIEFAFELRLRRSDGEYRWMSGNGVPRFAPDGQLLGYAGSTVDITERKQALAASVEAQLELSRELHERRRVEEQVLSLSNRLIRAHEDERARIARELHDDLSQRVAAVGIMLSAVKSDVTSRESGPPSDAKLKERLERAYSQLGQVAEIIRNLSHQLHPAAIEHGGLTAALRSHCKEFSNLTGVQVRFTTQDAFSDIPSNIALVIFRVAQEALQNVVKHSGASAATVSLNRGESSVSLTVCDKGRGFDPAKNGGTPPGLGLLSMRERIRLVDGTLEITSAPGTGTTIKASVPLDR